MDVTHLASRLWVCAASQSRHHRLGSQEIKVQMDSSEQRKQVTGATNVLIFSWHFKYLCVSAELSNVLDNTSRPSISAGLRQGHDLLWKLTKTKIRLCRRCGTTPLPLLRLSGWVCVSVQRKNKDWQMRHCGHPHFLSRPVPCSPLYQNLLLSSGTLGSCPENYFMDLGQDLFKAP